jgi:large subunit ribosomal protein L21
MFAIITVSGKQQKVKTGDVVSVDKLSGGVGDTVVFDNVLLVHDGGKTKIGTPNVTRVVVKAKILEQYKGEKIDSMRFRAKSRYRRKRGFRPQLTKIEIISIG